MADLAMADLDGVWDVRRVSGALPPLNGVRKRIDGDHGETVVVRGPGMPFDVKGLELRYRAPFAFLVDRLEPSGSGFQGTATAFGRTYGEFELRRSPVGDIHAQLVKHIDEAHALEQNVLRMLDSMIQTTDDAETLDRLEQHKLETQEHVTKMRRRLEYHGAEPSMVRQAAGILEALMKVPLDLVRGDKAGRNARDAYATEHLEIAAYELLWRIAQRAGDAETMTACERILTEERRAAERIASTWDAAIDAALTKLDVTRAS